MGKKEIRGQVLLSCDMLFQDLTPSTPQKQLKALKKGLKNKQTELAGLDKNNPSNKKRITELNTQIKSYPAIISAKENAIASLQAKEQTNSAQGKKGGAHSTAKNAVATISTVKRCKTTKCKPKPKVKFLGNICITIDHLDTSPKGYTTEYIVKQLLGKELVKTIDNKRTYKIKKPIPVTVFIQAVGGTVLDKGTPKLKGKVPRQKVHHLSIDQKKMLLKLKSYTGVKLGVHLLGSQDLVINGNRSNLINDPNTEAQMQLDNITYLKSILKDNRIASYHGANAASVKSANHALVQKQFNQIRDTESASPTEKRLDLINNQTTSAFFFHAAELSHNSKKHTIYRTLLEGIQSGKYRAVPY